ncbi:MAG: HEAT repeat domain-containing protein, partial [Planctomycetota bacterium]
ELLAEKIHTLPGTGQVLLIEALATRRDKAAMPVAVAATRSGDEAVRLAGIRSLATLGDASVVPSLIETTLAGGEASGTARESLQQVFGEGVDEAITAAMKRQTDLGRRGTLIDVLSARKAVAAAPALIEEATSDDAGIRSRAVRALGGLAGPKHVAAMVELL